MSTKLNKAILKVAQQNPEFAKALTAELGKTANSQLQRALTDSFQAAVKNAEKLLANEPEKVEERIQSFEKYTKQSYAKLTKTLAGLQGRGQATWGMEFLADRLDTYLQQRAYLQTLKMGH